MPRKQTKLPVVDKPEGSAVIIALGKRVVFEGSDREDLCCGACGKRLSRHMSAVSLAMEFSGPHPVFLKCCCGAHCLVYSGITH
jgi:hypothetical protein